MLQIPPYPLVGVQLGGIRRQVLEREPATVFDDEVLHPDGLVWVDVVPNHDDPAAHVTKQVSEEDENLRGGNRSRSNQDVQLPLGADAGDRGELGPAIAVSDQGRLPFRGPRPDASGNQSEATLVGEDQRGLLPAGFFLIRGQSSRSHR